MNRKYDEVIFFLLEEYTMIRFGSSEMQVGQGFAKQVVPVLRALPKTVD
jgi:hypothetical protein